MTYQGVLVMLQGRPRPDVQRDIRAKERAREQLVRKHRSASLPEVGGASCMHVRLVAPGGRSGSAGIACVGTSCTSTPLPWRLYMVVTGVQETSTCNTAL